MAKKLKSMAFPMMQSLTYPSLLPKAKATRSFMTPILGTH